MDLELTKPINLGMDIVECEMDRLPSVKMAVSVNAPHATGSLTYFVNDLWFECDVWDKFVNELRRLILVDGVKVASLASMSNEFCLTVSLSDDRRGSILAISLMEHSSDLGDMSVSIQTSLSIDDIGYLAENFSNVVFW